jgi:hypothetical protein
MAAILGIAVVLVAFQDGRNPIFSTLRATDACGPAEALKVIAAVLVIAKLLNQLAEIKRVFHRSTHA